MTELKSVIETTEELSVEEQIGKAASEYVKLQAKISEIESQLKLLTKRQSELKDFFKQNRTGEENEVMHVRYKKAKFSIIFKDSTRNMMDQAAVKERYALLGEAVPMKASISTRYEVIRA